tara:strand:- start:9 stop:761 length:753 start_codon:yes stop_codon:yes gene_type:complete
MYTYHKLYNDKITIKFDEEAHKYYVNGNEYFSATTLIGQGCVKPGLERWKRITPMIEYKKKLNKVLDDNEQLDRIKLERLYKESMEHTDNVSDDASLVGSVVHGLVEDFIKGKEIPNQSDPAVVNCWNLFLDWWNQQNYKVVDIEKKLFSKKYGYVGTLDLVVKNDKGEFVLIDLKTSNQIVFGYVLQANAYKQAYEEETGRKISSCFCLRVGKKDTKVEIAPIPLNKKLFNTFLGVKMIVEQRESSKYK